MATIANNRKIGKRREGEGVKYFRDHAIPARLGRSNEAADIILQAHNILLEVKTTGKGYWSPTMIGPKAIEQFHTLQRIREEQNAEIYYYIRFKGHGMKGVRIFPLPDKMEKFLPDGGTGIDDFIAGLLRRLETA